MQTVWDDTADAEKPAIVAILLAVTVGQIAIGATMDTIDRLPFFGDLFELIGVAVVATYVYKYVTDPSERCVGLWRRAWAACMHGHRIWAQVDLIHAP